jgi:hypothetical protein
MKKLQKDSLLELFKNKTNSVNNLTLLKGGKAKQCPEHATYQKTGTSGNSSTKGDYVGQDYSGGWNCTQGY